MQDVEDRYYLEGCATALSRAKIALKEADFPGQYVDDEVRTITSNLQKLLKALGETPCGFCGRYLTDSPDFGMVSCTRPSHFEIFKIVNLLKNGE